MSDANKQLLGGLNRALPISLLRAREVTMRKLNKLAASHNITVQQWRVICALADEEPLDAKTLSKRCVILGPSLTRILKILVSKGLIHSLKTEDIRRHSVILTKAGRELFDQASGPAESVYNEIEQAFGSENLVQLLDLLDLLCSKIEKLDLNLPSPSQTK